MKIAHNVEEMKVGDVYRSDAGEVVYRHRDGRLMYIARDGDNYELHRRYGNEWPVRRVVKQ